MSHSHAKQHYALNSNECLTHISMADSSNEQKYFCPYCHKEMITKKGDIRQWHFAHKSDNCSYDNYLHSIAEIMIMNWFNQKEQILLLLKNYEKCDKYDHCDFRNKTNCKRSRREQFNLKDYYSKCIKEHKYKNFIADLYCENDKNPNSPIFIEIFVTHECSEEKKNSGIRIIELVIQSEEDIKRIIESDTLSESEIIRLYNFKPKPKLSESFSTTFFKYILYSSQKSNIMPYSCTNYNTLRKGIYEVSVHKNILKDFFDNNTYKFMITGKILAFLDGYLKRDCLICIWQAQDFNGNRICKLYKRCGNPKFCEDNDVSKCSMFRVNPKCLITILNEEDALRNNPHIDIWKSESNSKKERHFDIASLEKELASQESNSYNKNDIRTAIETQTYYCGDDSDGIVDLGDICKQHIKNFLLPVLNNISDTITINFFTANSSHKLICVVSFYKDDENVKYNIDFSASDFI